MGKGRGKEGSQEGTGYEEWGKEEARGRARTRTKVRGVSGDVN